MKPIYKYLGGKSKELKHFVDLIPKDYSTYCEPFFGGGAVFWALEPEKAVINDRDEDLMQFLLAVKNVPGIFDDVLNWPTDKESFYKIRDEFGRDVPDNVYKLQRYFYFLRQSFNGLLRYNAKKDKYNMSCGVDRPVIPLNPQASEVLKNTLILSGDWKKAVDKVKFDKDAFIFLDPPYDGLFSYLLDSEENKAGMPELYKDIKYFMENTKARVLLTINATPQIEELFKDFIVRRYSQKQTFGAHCHGKDLMKETLVCINYKPETQQEVTDETQKKEKKSVNIIIDKKEESPKSMPKTLKIDTICIEGPDKTGKDTLAAYLSQMTRDIIITVRGMISNTAYHRLFNRQECKYDVKAHSHELYVLLDSETEDQKIRCKLTNEKESNYEVQRVMFRAVADEYKDKGLIVVDANTTKETPYVLAQRIMKLITHLNSKEE